MSARDFSVMPVLLIDHDKVSLERAVRGRGSMTPGSFVDVEFGATWATKRGETFKVPGSWRQCEIVKVVHSELWVRLSPSSVKGPSELG